MHRKHRFAYIAEVDISVDDGPGINEREFVHELLERHDDEVVCVLPYPARPGVCFDKRIAYVPSHRKRNPAFYLVYNVALLVRIARLHRERPFDALVFRLNLIPLVPILLHRLLKVPIILKTLAGYTTFSEEASWKHKAVSMTTWPLYRMSIRSALAADTVSIPYIDWLAAKFGIEKKRITLIPNGANTVMFSPGDAGACRKKFNIGESDFVIGYVGALATLRHVDLLIRMLGRLATDRKVCLVLVGKGPDQGLLEGLADELGVRDKVVFTGFVPYSEVPDIMNTFDVAVDLTRVPMEIGGEVVEASYSQKIPQYLACGLPVVAWDVPDNRFLESGRIGSLVGLEGDAAGKLLEAVQKLVDLPAEEKAGMGARAREYAERWFSVRGLTDRRIAFWRSSVG